MIARTEAAEQLAAAMAEMRRGLAAQREHARMLALALAEAEVAMQEIERFSSVLLGSE